MLNISNFISAHPNFPKEGILFRDISPLLASPEAFQKVIDEFAKIVQEKNITAIYGIDARGFVFGSALALQCKIPFYMVRKEGKLPGDTIQESYSLEYGENILEIQKNDLSSEDNILIVDDLLATGGTLEASIKLIEKTLAKIGAIACVIELIELKGREKIEKYPVYSLIKY